MAGGAGQECPASSHGFLTSSREGLPQHAHQLRLRLSPGEAGAACLDAVFRAILVARCAVHGDLSPPRDDEGPLEVVEVPRRPAQPVSEHDKVLGSAGCTAESVRADAASLGWQEAWRGGMRVRGGHLAKATGRLLEAGIQGAAAPRRGPEGGPPRCSSQRVLQGLRVRPRASTSHCGCGAWDRDRWMFATCGSLLHCLEFSCIVAFGGESHEASEETK